MENKGYVRSFRDLRIKDIEISGGKNASLGEMISQLESRGIRVPDGFAITSEGYLAFIKENQIEKEIKSQLSGLDSDPKSLQKVGKIIRKLILNGKFSRELTEQITNAYHNLSEKYQTKEVSVAIRSSATTEDLDTASFAGQQETYLNIKGIEEVLHAVRMCFASLFTDRAIYYRAERGFNQKEMALSVGVQKMVRSDKASSGVIFTIHTETGFDKIIVITSSWGLGENIVKGLVIPDEYLVFKPLLGNEKYIPIVGKSLGNKESKLIYSKKGTKNIKTSKEEQDIFTLSDEEVMTLSKWALIIEEHYGKPMDIEWAKDGETNELYIVQARPETVQSQIKKGSYKTYRLKEKGEKLAGGFAVGEAIAVGVPQVIKDVKEINSFKKGSILVTEKTDPDWVPIMKIAKGIITDQGGRTSHAAIVSRELSIPAIVGTGNGTKVLQNVPEITMSCAEGDMGVIYKGSLPFVEEEINLQEMPETRTQIMLNIASPDAAFKWWRLPCKGIGLARMEFIINNIIKIHPMALVQFDSLADKEAKKRIVELTRGYTDKVEYFIDHLSRGIAQIASSQYPHPVIVRMSDFKTNEYANLIGGKQFEPMEENPMLGFRGASRYYNPKYRDGFHLECLAIKRVREVMGLTNVLIMIPFCRTVEEADAIIKVLRENGLSRGENGLQIYVMAEIPSNVVLAEEFSKRFDGFSIGSNDLTQLILGIDRDSSELAPLFNERNPAVKKMIESLIQTAHKEGRKVGICGQAPSDYPEFAEFLVRLGIDSISLNPDSVIATILHIAKVEKE